MSKIDSQDTFIAQYNIAIQAGMTLKQFAEYLEIQPASVVRRRNKIKQEFGLQLELLPLDNGDRLVTMPSGPLASQIEHNKYTIVQRSDTRKRIVITSAQNATPVFKPFITSLLNYCETMDAQLMVIPYRYKNATSIWNANNETDEWWDNTIVPYLVQDYTQICPGLRIMGHIRIQPTATNPLSGFDSYTGIDSAIFGHPKVQLTTVPTPSKLLPKVLTTTGSCTKQNYTDSKSGHQGFFHHSLAAIVVELDDTGIFHIRHIHAEDDGSFYDLNYNFNNKTVESSNIAGLVTGDSHVEFIDQLVVNATYSNVDSMVNVLKPSVVVMHDIEDFYPRNHHHKLHPFLSYGKQHFGRNNVEASLQLTANFLDTCMPAGITRVVVKSNHDEAFDRWLREADPKTDPENARFYHYMMYNLFSKLKSTATGFSWPDPFEFWCKNPDQHKGLQNKKDVMFLSRDESYMIGGIEVGFHGDKGPNGSRGSARSFSKIGPKTVIAHSHTPKIDEGVYQVGLSARMDLEYVSGPSSWMQTHCIIYPNGKRTLINIINGKWKM